MNERLRDAVSYHQEHFPPQNLDYNQFINELLKAQGALGRFDQMLKTLHNSEILLAPLRNREAIMSSRMEGTISTMDEILKYEADHEEGSEDTESGVRSDVIETLLYRRALKATQNALEQGYPLSASLIKQTHQLLLSFGRGQTKSPGEYKTEQNFLADARKQTILYVPISPEKLPSAMDQLFDYIATNTEPDLVRAAVAHLEFEALHPFKDGNGRIGRMLITLMLWHSNLISAPHFYISGYFEEHKDEYIDTMRQVSATGDWHPWCRFFLEAVEAQALSNLEIAQSIRGLYEEMKIRFADLLSSKWAMSTLDFVFTNPVFRNSKLTQIGASTQTASRFSRILLEEGLLACVEEASGSRAALYSFEPLMRLVRV